MRSYLKCSAGEERAEDQRIRGNWVEGAIREGGGEWRRETIVII